MVYLAPVFLIIISYLAGELFCKIFCDNTKNLVEKCLIGTLFVLISWGLYVTIMRGFTDSFSSIAWSYSVFLLALFTAALLFSWKNIKKNLEVKNVSSLWPVVICLSIILVQFLAIALVKPNAVYDYTLETVNTTLATDNLFDYHPGMGILVEYAVSDRGKLVTLPLFYAYLSKIFGGHPARIVYMMIPMWGILLNFMVYGLWADGLLEDDKEKGSKKTLFLVGLGLLNIGGLFVNESVFYYIMEKGFTGKSICYNMIIPYMIYLAYNIVVKKRYKDIIYLLMAVGSTVAITDIQTGLVPALICLAVMTIIALVYKIGGMIKWR